MNFFWTKKLNTIWNKIKMLLSQNSFCINFYFRFRRSIPNLRKKEHCAHIKRTISEPRIILFFLNLSKNSLIFGRGSRKDWSLISYSSSFLLTCRMEHQERLSLFIDFSHNVERSSGSESELSSFKTHQQTGSFFFTIFLK